MSRYSVSAVLTLTHVGGHATHRGNTPAHVPFERQRMVGEPVAIETPRLKYVDVACDCAGVGLLDILCDHVGVTSRFDSCVNGDGVDWREKNSARADTCHSGGGHIPFSPTSPLFPPTHQYTLAQ